MSNGINGTGWAAKASRRIWAKKRKQWFAANPAEVYICALCNEPIEGEPVSLDHIVPVSRGGDWRDINNLQPTHHLCNTRRGSKPAPQAQEDGNT